MSQPMKALAKGIRKTRVLVWQEGLVINPPQELRKRTLCNLKLGSKGKAKLFYSQRLIGLRIHAQCL